MPSLAWPLILGFGLGLSLAVPPGPILALAAERTVNRGFWPGVSVPLGATTGDGTQALLMGLGILPVLAAFPLVLAGVNVLGAGLLFAFAWLAWQSARQGADPTDAADPDQHDGGVLVGGFWGGYMLALTSPYNFAWWLSVGTALFQDYGPLLFIGFFAALVAWSFAFVALTAWASERVEGVVVWISYASALLLAGFGVVVLRGAVMDLVALTGA